MTLTSFNYNIKYPILVFQSALIFHLKKNGIAFKTLVIPTCPRFLLSDVFRQFHNLFSFQDCSWFGFIIYYGLNLLLLTYSLHFAQIATNVNEGLIFTKCFPSYQIWIIPDRFWLDDHHWWLMGLVFEMSAFGHCVTKWGSGEISEWSPLSLISVLSQIIHRDKTVYSSTALISTMTLHLCNPENAGVDTSFLKCTFHNMYIYNLKLCNKQKFKKSLICPV